MVRSTSRKRPHAREQYRQLQLFLVEKAVNCWSAQFQMQVLTPKLRVYSALRDLTGIALAISAQIDAAWVWSMHRGFHIM